MYHKKLVQTFTKLKSLKRSQKVMDLCILFFRNVNEFFLYDGVLLLSKKRLVFTNLI